MDGWMHGWMDGLIRALPHVPALRREDQVATPEPVTQLKPGGGFPPAAQWDNPCGRSVPDPVLISQQSRSLLFPHSRLRMTAGIRLAQAM